MVATMGRIRQSAFSIIAVLAAMLLPALAAAREKARRSSCVNNLTQQARAVESYCGDYGSYYPAWPGYDVASGSGGSRTAWSAMPDNTGSSGNGSLGGAYRDRNGSFCYTKWYSTSERGAPHQKVDAIFSGFKPVGSTMTAGEANVAPQGLGMLSAGGYLGDMRVFFCPSLGGGGGSVTSEKSWGLPTKTKDMVAARGPDLVSTKTNKQMDAESLIHADMTDVWKSDYNIRSAIIVCAYGFRGNAWSHGNVWPQTKPATPAAGSYYGNMIVNPFKTQKILSNRALSMDTFSRVANSQSSPAEPGVGYYGHRDGYNVLYGDYHVRWYGDPQQQIIWMNDYAWSNSGARTVDTVDFAHESWGWMNCYRKPHGGAMWHMLDHADGIDLGAENDL